MAGVNKVQSARFSSSSTVVASSSFVGRYWKELRRRSINTVTALLIFYSVPAFCCLFAIKTTAMSLITPNQRPNCYETVPELNHSEQYRRYILRTLQSTVTYLAFPLMGWMAEIVIGRTKIIHISLYAMWLGMLLQTVGYTTQSMTCGTPFNISKYMFIPISMLFLIIGTAGFFSNLPAYILEQMISEPSDKLRAAVYWMTWSLFVGLESQFLCFPDNAHDYVNANENTTPIICGNISVFSLLSIAIVLSVVFRSRFSVIGTMKKNSIKLVCRVILYAYKQPPYQRRSALSYWDKKMPSKIDFGKVKYGGPFSNEDVEDVKSFWRVFVVLCTMLGLYIPISAISDNGMTYITMYKDSVHFLNGHTLFALLNSITIILIPVLEFILIPCIPKIDYWLQNSLKGMGVSYILFILCLFVMIVLDLVGQLTTDGEVGCYLNSATIYNLSFLYYSCTLLLYNIADALNFIFTLQFLMSQAPGTMCGLLTGLFWLLRALGSNIAQFIDIPFDLGNAHGSAKSRLSCSFWILLIYFFICLVSFLFYIKVARWYQNRKKGDTFLGKVIVEEYYERLIDQGIGEASYPPLLPKNISYFEYEATLQNTNSTIR